MRHDLQNSAAVMESQFEMKFMDSINLTQSSDQYKTHGQKYIIILLIKQVLYCPL
jgi:hypothetical protein